MCHFYFVLPFEFGRTQEHYNPKLIKKIEKQFPIVKIFRLKKDYGPITKLLPVAKLKKRHEPNCIIITIDDDICYPLGMVNEIIYQRVMKYPKCVLHTSGGFYIRSQIREFSKLWPRPSFPLMDILEGFSGVAYSPKFLNIKLLIKLSKKNYCFVSDDLVISYVLALKKIDIRNIENRYWYMPLPYAYGE